MGSRSIESDGTNLFERTSFNRCDLARSVHFGEIYRSCLFENCKIRHLFFHGSVFEGCTFIGELHDVTFLKRDAFDPDRPMNEMKGCDLSGCELSFVSFRNIDLSTALLPRGSEYVQLADGPRTLSRWSSRFRDARDEGRRWLADLLAERAGSPTILNLSDYRENFSEADFQALRDLAMERPGDD